MKQSTRNALDNLVQDSNTLLNETRDLYRQIKFPGALPRGWTGPVGSTISGWSELHWVQENIGIIMCIQMQAKRALGIES